MPILIPILMSNWTEEEHKISDNLKKYGDSNKCKNELNSLKDNNRFYSIIKDEYDYLYLTIYTL